MHIAIEGIDGVGKTTAAKLAAKALSFDFIEKPLSHIFDTDNSCKNYIRIRDWFNNQPDRFLSAWFYGLGNIYLYQQFKGKNIITDRHLLSNFCWSGTDDNVEVFDLLVKQIGAPDYTFILYADEKTVLSRIKNRDKDDPDMKKTKYIPNAYTKMEWFCKKYSMPYTLIDTSALDAQSVADRIISKTRELVK